MTTKTKTSAELTEQAAQLAEQARQVQAWEQDHARAETLVRQEAEQQHVTEVVEHGIGPDAVRRIELAWAAIVDAMINGDANDVHVAWLQYETTRGQGIDVSQVVHNLGVHHDVPGTPRPAGARWRDHPPTVGDAYAEAGRRIAARAGAAAVASLEEEHARRSDQAASQVPKDAVARAIGWFVADDESPTPGDRRRSWDLRLPLADGLERVSTRVVRALTVNAARGLRVTASNLASDVREIDEHTADQLIREDNEGTAA